MDITLLHEFVVLAQSETFLKAAELLYVSQPTLSRHIKSLETELGVSLFERTTRKCKLTKYGHLLLPYATHITELYSTFFNDLRAEKQEELTGIRIGSSPAMGYYGINNFLSHFRKTFPEVKIELIPQHNMDVIKMMEMHNCEFAFVRENPDDIYENFVHHPLAMDHLVAVVPSGHVLADRKTLSPADIGDEKILSLPPETIICEATVNSFRQAGAEANIIMHNHNVEHLLNCVQMGMGVAVVLSSQAERFLDQTENLRIIDITPLARLQISLCYLKSADLTDDGEKFIKLFSKNYETSF
ncbi:MAG: LysR family transcriptional regulator [Lachnospiraceae bacterium]|jgi:LysR family transcriptional activator of glutamate synthase operon